MSMPTESIQDYLKTIYLLDAEGREATTSLVAERLGVSPASVSAMARKLTARGLVAHSPYREMSLTPQGRRLALEVVRHHRLLETYLHRVLGMPWDEIHAEAEVLEHAISENLEDRIAEALGHPTHDPHGHPIPPKEGEHSEVTHDSLDAVPEGTRVRVERVADRDPDALRYLADLGVVPGTELVVREQSPFEGPVWVQVGRRRHALGRELARQVFVSAAAAEDGRPGSR